MILASDVRRAMTAEYTDDEYVTMARLLNSIVDETERVLTIAKSLKAEYRRGAESQPNAEERIGATVTSDHCSNCRFSSESESGEEYFICHQPNPPKTFHKDTVFWCNKYERFHEPKAAERLEQS
jgi:hypothetical protein